MVDKLYDSEFDRVFKVKKNGLEVNLYFVFSNFRYRLKIICSYFFKVLLCWSYITTFTGHKHVDKVLVEESIDYFTRTRSIRNFRCIYLIIWIVAEQLITCKHCILVFNDLLHKSIFLNNMHPIIKYMHNIK